MPRIAFMFPGQGSQQPGMGRTLAEAFPEAREVFDTADRVLETALSATCFEGSEAELALTETTQPAILTCSVAVLRVLLAAGIEPRAAAGHSLGEYSAHVAAGTLGFEDAVRTVRLRGRFMQAAVPAGEGAMAAILGLDAGAVETLCTRAAEGQVLSPANLNGPGQIVIAGHADAVGRAVELAPDAGAKKAVLLNVSAPFHCALMQPAAHRLAPVLESLSFSPPAIAVYCNVDASAVADGDAARDALLRQVVAPVRWEESMRRMIADGYDTFVEVGPGRVLSGLLRRIDRGARALSVADPESLEKALESLKGASK